jgi:hypothetical protein
VLKIRIHHSHDGRTRRQHALYAGAGKTAASDPAQTAHARVVKRKLLRPLGRAVRRVVVDKDGFPVDARECNIETPDLFGDVVAFLERRENDRKLWCAASNRRGAIRSRLM